MKSFFQSKNFLFVLSLMIWMFAFKKFLFGDAYLKGDANAYYEHFEFFYRNIIRGVFPLWESTRDSGVPAEFFLRRIGEFNPFYSVIFILNKMGVPYMRSYLLFQSLYFFLGMAGFYKLACFVLKDKLTAFVGFLLFMFSSSSALLFNSFTFLIFTPMVWFFYFLFVFAQTPGKKILLGMTFCSMILLCTYIPLYFLTILISFILFYSLFYFERLGNILRVVSQFVMGNKLFVFICLSLLIVATVPDLLFFRESQRGEFVLPMRNAFYMGAENVLEVSEQNTSQGGVIATNFFQEPFANLKNIKTGIFYVPVFVWILFLLGLRVPFNRKLCFMLIWGVGIYFMSVLEAGPVYRFLFKHIFYFKYFRNFQFFLWLVLLPLFILLCCEHLRLFLNEKLKSVANNRSWDVISRLGFLILIHAALLIFLWKQPGALVTSYVGVVLSLIFFIGYELNFFGCGPFALGSVSLRGVPCTTKQSFNESEGLLLRQNLPAGRQESWRIAMTPEHKSIFCLFFILLVVVIPSLEVYTYLGRNTPSFVRKFPYRYSGTTPYLKLELPDQVSIDQNNQITDDNLELRWRMPGALYYSTAAYAFLHEHINHEILDRYIQRGRLLLYDHAQELNYQDLEMDQFAGMLMTNANHAFIFPDRFNKNDKMILDNKISNLPAHTMINLQEGKAKQNTAMQATVVGNNYPGIEVSRVDVNYLKLKTNFSSKKFLVYNDNFYTGWHAFINGQAVPILRANLAFKGIWVPEGEQEVCFRFGSPWQHFLKFFLMFVFYGVLVYFFYLLKMESYESHHAKNC